MLLPAVLLTTTSTNRSPVPAVVPLVAMVQQQGTGRMRPPSTRQRCVVWPASSVHTCPVLLALSYPKHIIYCPTVEVLNPQSLASNPMPCARSHCTLTCCNVHCHTATLLSPNDYDAIEGVGQVWQANIRGCPDGLAVRKALATDGPRQQCKSTPRRFARTIGSAWSFDRASTCQHMYNHVHHASLGHAYLTVFEHSGACYTAGLTMVQDARPPSARSCSLDRLLPHSDAPTN